MKHTPPFFPASLFLGVAALILPAPTVCADAESFRTPEYMASGGTEEKSALDWINAAEAYALGYTGKGVTIGITDSNAYPEHREFAGKPYQVLRQGATLSELDHGVHVSGIAAANRDGLGMHGVAFDAGLVGITISFAEKDSARNAVYALLDYPQVRVANASWGARWSLADALEQGAELIEGDSAVQAFARVAAEQDILFVVAEGNDALSSPSTNANNPALVLGTRLIGQPAASPAILYDFPTLTAAERRALSLNILSIANLNPNAKSTNSVAFVSRDSNLADGATDQTLMAPGENIWSAAAGSPDRYMYMSGTSMAAPFVTGVAALVGEAFPFMGGKQIGDVLLSTATPIAAADEDIDAAPPFIFQTRPDAIHIIIRESALPASGPWSAMLAGREDELRELLVSTYDSAAGLSLEEFTARLAAKIDNGQSAHGAAPYDNAYMVYVVSDADFLKLFGMGIVNAGRAVRGPGWLDAHRLGNADRRDYGGVGYAMYPVDTQGYSATWSNDIAQVCVNGCANAGEENYPGYRFAPGYVDPGVAAEFYGELTGLPVGLLKSGRGTLTLTGNNGYTGPTAVEGGTLALGIAGQTDGEARLAGSVIVGEAGTFTGNGSVAGDIDFAGTLEPGLRAQPGSTLTVAGRVTGSGTLLTNISPDGQANTLTAGGAIDLARATLALGGLPGNTAPTSDYVLATSAAGQIAAPANESADLLQGSTLLHNYRLGLTPGELTASHTGSRVRPEAKALSEGHLAGLALLDGGADLVSGSGLEAARTTPGAFAALEYGAHRYKTGSHIGVRSLNLLTGVSASADSLTLGAFFEAGRGGNDTYNAFPETRIHGTGRAHYAGFGVLAQKDFAESETGQAHIEASFRGGRIHNDYDSRSLTDFNGRPAKFDARSAYLGGHWGAGYTWQLSAGRELKLYGQYLATRMKSDAARLSTGETVRFRNASSERLRIGTRFTWTNKTIHPYAGLAWEREFAGRQRATIDGHATGIPTLRGDTGIAEFGLKVKPSRKYPLTLELALKAYAGVHRGGAGGVRARWEF